MQLSPKHYDTVLADFLASWNLDRIRRMSISEYADLTDHDSLCYWLEYGTKQLGAIGRIPLTKFELWKPSKIKKFKDDRYRMESVYAYKASKGNNLNDAFLKIRQLLVETVSYSLQQNWSAIDDIDLNIIGKWKLACLFSGKRLLPVYSMRALLAIANGLGYRFGPHEKVSVLQAAILSHKPANEDVVDYSYRLYRQFAQRRKDSKRYFIIGSRFGGAFSVMESFLQHQCVAMNWMDGFNFSPYMGANLNVINRIVEDNWDEDKPPVATIKSYFRLFSQIREGDIIAVKSQGSYNQLTIIAYAQVVKRNDSIYFHDPNLLGHHIHVEFLEAGFEKNIGENYAATIHELTPEKDGAVFHDVFGWYVQPAVANDEEEGIIEEMPDEEPGENEESSFEEGYNEKSESSFERTPGAAVIVNRIHNRIQNRFVRYLTATYRDDAVSGEKSHVDARRLCGDDLYLYEIKPFSSVYYCVREGIGQLLDYLHQDSSPKNKILVIVGPAKPDPADLRFITKIRSVMNVPFQYLAFDEINLIGTEF